MSDAVSCAEIDEQHVALLPERTLMSMLFLADPGKGGNTNSGNATCGVFTQILSNIGITLPGNTCTGAASGTNS